MVELAVHVDDIVGVKVANFEAEPLFVPVVVEVTASLDVRVSLRLCDVDCVPKADLLVETLLLAEPLLLDEPGRLCVSEGDVEVLGEGARVPEGAGVGKPVCFKGEEGVGWGGVGVGGRVDVEAQASEDSPTWLCVCVGDCV